MTDSELQMLEEILARIMEESPYLQRLCDEAKEYDFGENFVSFGYRHYKLKLELKIDK